MFLHWRTNSIFVAPFGHPLSLSNGMPRYSSSPAPLFSGKRYATNSDQNIISFIVALLSFGGPRAILWAVVSVVVFSLKSMVTGWRVAHVSKKVLKRMFPPFADLYATTPVVFIMGRVFVIAPVFHVLPNAINRFSSQAMGFACLAVFAKTPAGFDSARSEVVATGNSGFPAIAEAKPGYIIPLSCSAVPFDYSEKVELFSGKIFNRVHDTLQAKGASILGLWQALCLSQNFSGATLSTERL